MSQKPSRGRSSILGVEKTMFIGTGGSRFGWLLTWQGLARSGFAEKVAFAQTVRRLLRKLKARLAVACEAISRLAGAQQALGLARRDAVMHSGAVKPSDRLSAGLL
jgi:hypothetical protein